jgi:hypothetical protein
MRIEQQHVRKWDWSSQDTLQTRKTVDELVDGPDQGICRCSSVVKQKEHKNVTNCWWVRRNICYVEVLQHKNSEE